MTLPIGTELGGYVLSGVLGAGASGTVYRARDADGLPVALKLLHPSSAADAASRRRLRREVRAQRAIRSPFVAQVVDAELDGAEAFIVTELVEGVSLAGDIAVNGPWGPESLADLARELDQALAAVHGADVLHRDVKPSNVVLDRDGRPVLIDFGIAQDSGAGRLTAAGMVAGTPGFVSPELLRGAEPSVDSDRWATAALLLNAATGRQPYGTGAVEAILARVLDGLPDVDGLPEHVAVAFQRALTPDASRRLSLLGLAEAISPCAGGVDSPTEQLLPPTRVAPVGDAAELWTEPVRPPWREPRRVDYRTWLRHAQAPAEDVSAPPGARTQSPPPPADAVAPIQPYPPPPPRSGLLTLGLWAFLAATALYWPWAAVIVAGAGLVVARTVWVAAESQAARRWRRGPRPSDRTRTVLGLPWYFLRGLGGSIPALALAALVGGGGYWLTVNLIEIDSGRPQAAAICVAVGLMAAWWGPSAQETRHGQRLIARGLLSARWARALVAAATLGGAAAIILTR